MDIPPDELADLSFDQLAELDARADAREAEQATESQSGGPTTEVVLPWYQHPVNIITLVITGAILAAMIGWMVGNNGAQPKHNEVDTGFLQDMRVHHEQAVLMGFIFRELPDTHPGLRTISASIVRGQSLEVGRMIQLLRSFGESEINEDEASMLWMGMSATPGQMPGIASDQEIEQLGLLSGEEADRFFVTLMTEHHLGGIEMADFTVATGINDEVTMMAASMASGQRGEIVEMASLIDG